MLDVSHLRLLKATINGILEGLDKAEIDGAINWADLGCTQVRYYVDDDGDTGFIATIEEAAPDSSDLIEAISEKLFEKGWLNVEIQTEW